MFGTLFVAGLLVTLALWVAYKKRQNDPSIGSRLTLDAFFVRAGRYDEGVHAS